MLTRMRKTAAAAVTGLVAAAAAVALAGCDANTSTPRGYTRIGVLNDATVYARQDPGAGRLQVIVRASDGGTLCDSSGSLGLARVPAICDDTAGDTYTYIAQRPKNAPDEALCNTPTGTRAPARLLTTPADWPFDFIAVERTTISQDAGVSPCRQA